MSMFRTAGVLLAAALTTMTARADDRATPEEAQLLVAETIAYFDMHGAEATIAAINADDPMFHQGDLYAFMWSDDGTIVAHPIDSSLVGTDGTALSDVDGKAFGKEIVEMAGAAGTWVDYKWLDPSTGEVEQKSSWVALHNGYIFGAGVYKP